MVHTSNNSVQLPCPSPSIFLFMFTSGGISFSTHAQLRFVLVSTRIIHRVWQVRMRYTFREGAEETLVRCIWSIADVRKALRWESSLLVFIRGDDELDP